MSKIIYFDYCALVVFGILLISVLMRKMTQSKANKIFIAMILLCVFTTVSDIVAVHLDMFGAGNLVAKYIFHAGYLFLHSLLSPMYIVYIIVRTDTMYKFRNNWLLRLVLWGPMVILACLLFLNLRTGRLYHFDANDSYTRGDMFVVLYIIGIYYALLGVCYLWIYRKTVTTSRYITLMAMIPVTLMAAIAQFFFPQFLLEMFANAIGILFIGLMIQRPEERLDSETGLEKLSAYVADMKRIFLLGKPVEVLMINVANSNALLDMVGYDGVKELNKHIVNEMLSVNRKYKLEAELYHLNNGKFRFIVNANSKQIEEVAQHMVVFMNAGIRLNQMDVHIVSNVCIARCPDDIDNIDSLLAFGNDLNEKKGNGEVLHSSKDYHREHYDLQRDIDMIIESALANHRFSVYYQPIYSLKEKRFLSAEALLRLKDENYGFISPEIIISAAEKSGAIHKIGEFVLEEVCKFISGEEFAQLGLDYIEVNLSVVQCMQSNLATQILDILKRYNVRPAQINLEITETAASYSQNTIMQNVTALTEAGIYFSLDDFGTGYSNMRRIASMPFHLVKLDKSFTHAEDNPRLQIVLKNIVEMIKAMNMQIVVEGVETEDMVERFAGLQCEYIQGYYYSKPLAEREFVEFLVKWIDTRKEIY